MKTSLLMDPLGSRRPGLVGVLILGGGDGDGYLDATDPTFNSLLLWTDGNHDGISQPEELQTANQAGVRRIDLEYQRSRRTDRHGNVFAFAGRGWKEGPRGVVHPIGTWDVFFLKMP